MEPNGQYLCIVPGRSNGSLADNRRLFISKAFLLAVDKSIKDPTNLRQIRP